MLTKKVLAILSEYGYWGAGLVKLLEKLEQIGFEVEFMTPKRKTAVTLPPSYDTTFVDSPLGVYVTMPEAAEKVKAFEATGRLANVLNMGDFIPRSPYQSAANFFRKRLHEITLVFKNVTGHCIEYDYHNGTGFMNTDFNIGPPPYVMEYILADAVGTGGQFHGNFSKVTSVIVDYSFITARSMQYSLGFDEKNLNVPDNNVKRYGW